MGLCLDEQDDPRLSVVELEVRRRSVVFYIPRASAYEAPEGSVILEIDNDMVASVQAALEVAAERLATDA